MADTMATTSTSSAEVPVLLSFSVFSRPVLLPQGSGRDAILQSFASQFPRELDVRARHVLQVFSEQWGQYVDAPPDFTVSHGHAPCKLRLEPCCNPRGKVVPLGNLCQKTTAFFCCDLQERFRPAISYFEDIVAVAQRLLQGAGILDIPVIVSEQYPKGLGKTVPELDVNGARLLFPKTRFSMVLEETEAVLETLPALRSIVLFGIEAHVCIQQTALDLIGRGYEVHVVVDATSSRSMVDRMFAFQRLSGAGAVITTSEAVLLQLVGDKEHPEFKEVQSIIKTSAPHSGLLAMKV